MSGRDDRLVAFSLAAVTTAAVTGCTWINSRKNNILAGGSPIARLSPCPDVNWIGQDAFNVLTAICDAFIPAVNPSELSKSRVYDAILSIHPELPSCLAECDQNFLATNGPYLCRGAICMDLHTLAAKAIDALITKSEQSELALMLNILSTSVGCFLTAGYPMPFQALPLHERVQALKGWRDSSIAKLRIFYQTMKRITGNLFFSYVDHGVDNPNWQGLGYNPAETVGKGPVLTAAQRAERERVDILLRRKVQYDNVKRALQLATSTSSTTSSPTLASPDTDVLECDVVIVGSGAGGGMMAAELAKAGVNVLVLEKGGHFRASEFEAWRESEAFLHTFEKGGLCSTAEGNVLVLAGSCVGGGTTINWSASFRTPDIVREDWVQLGLKDFEKGGAFDRSLDAVHRQLNVNSDNSFRLRHDHRGSCGTNGVTGGEGGCGASGEKAPFVVNGNNQLLWEGAEKLGFTPEKIPRNVKGCVDCGHCCHGCPYESKQSTLTALMEPLMLAGEAAAGCSAGAGGAGGQGYKLHLLPHCEVHKIIYTDANEQVRGGDGRAFPCSRRAVGVEATVRVLPENFPEMSIKDRLHYLAYGEKTLRRLHVKAKIMVSAAGALHTPALLLRSGLRHKGLVGASLTLHPVLGVGGVFPHEKTRLASGVSMGVVVRQPPLSSKTTAFSFSPTITSTTTTTTTTTAPALQDVEERHRIAIETPPAHVGLMGLLFPWIVSRNAPRSFSGQGGGLGIKLGMLSWRHSATFIALPRDRSQPQNCVTIDSYGNPVLHYAMTPADAKLVMVGLEANLRLMRAAGAKFVYCAHESLPWHNAQQMGSSDDEGARFEAYLQQVHKEGLQTAKMQIFSAHQLSSCRMSATPESGPVSPSGELWECAGVFVADGSVLPTSLGINPMVTIEAFAHMIAGNVVCKVEQEHPDMAQKTKEFRRARGQQEGW